jgi:hypothetical protein
MRLLVSVAPGRLGSPQDILPPNATAAKLRDSPLSSSELDAVENDVEEN